MDLQSAPVPEPTPADDNSGFAYHAHAAVKEAATDTPDGGIGEDTEPLVRTVGNVEAPLVEPVPAVNANAQPHVERLERYASAAECWC